jgi:hypothetical protein
MLILGVVTGASLAVASPPTHDRGRHVPRPTAIATPTSSPGANAAFREEHPASGCARSVSAVARGLGHREDAIADLFRTCGHVPEAIGLIKAALRLSRAGTAVAQRDRGGEQAGRLAPGEPTGTRRASIVPLRGPPQRNANLGIDRPDGRHLQGQGQRAHDEKGNNG